jgi:hypothetical protein
MNTQKSDKSDLYSSHSYKKKYPNNFLFPETQKEAIHKNIFFGR